MIKIFTGQIVKNDGAALEKLLKSEYEITSIHHKGNFVFEAETEQGETLTVHTEPFGEEYDEIKITGVTSGGVGMQKYEITAKQTKDNLIDGSVNGWHFQAKVHDEGSRFGIKDGRVSKLIIWDENKRQSCGNIFKASILNYDRGWDIMPKSTADKSILQAVLDYLENLPTAEFWEEIAEGKSFDCPATLKNGNTVNTKVCVKHDGWGTMRESMTGFYLGKLNPIAVRDLLEQGEKHIIF
jgi:hypothetical protein